MKERMPGRKDLREASAFAHDVNLARDPFITILEEYFRESKLVVVSWYEDMKSGVSSVNVIIGARDKLELEKQVAMVKKLATEIHS